LLTLNVTWPLPVDESILLARVELVPFRDVLGGVLDPRFVLSDLLLDRADPSFDLCGWLARVVLEEAGVPSSGRGRLAAPSSDSAATTGATNGRDRSLDAADLVRPSIARGLGTFDEVSRASVLLGARS
jgi:hypothetical protein